MTQRVISIGEEQVRFGNRFVNVTETPVRFPDGSEGTFAKVTSGLGFGGVTIPRYVFRGEPYYGLALQHRFPIDEVTLEFPRGMTRDGSAAEALRELGEETGVDTSELIPVHLGDIHPDTGLLTTKVGVWLVTVKVPAKITHTEAESGAVTMWLHHGDLLGLIRSGKVSCGITLAAYAKLAASSYLNVPDV